MEIFLLIAGAILGVIFSEYWIKIKRNILNKVRYKKAVKNVQNLGFSPEPGFKYFDHAIPAYERNHLKTEMSDSKMIIEIPKEFAIHLNSSNFIFRKQNISAWEEQLKKTFNHLGIDNYQSILKESAYEVALQMQKDINYGLQRFNGEMLGVKQIHLQRIGEDEQSSLRITFYKTDFFTFRVFANIYQKYKHLIKVKGIQDLNSYYTPFLSSFGISNYLIIDDGKEDKVLFGYRSNNVSVDKNKIHYSMNEAFSLKDVDTTENHFKLSLNTCLKRGLREELGIASDIQDSNLEKFGFMSLLMDVNRFELGLSSYARLRIDESFTLSDFKRAYHSAQDSELETDGLSLIKIKDVPNFVKTNNLEMSVGARNVINTLLARYKAGYFK
ncbi:hypothetical protein [Marinifilum sp. D714]|uniref:hypothetical protein n=1 Tax=Marinifilum sp. D714 TaxID=2937523 RepID=UPI0027CF2D03|nr:hypothetical protein [Marinifilum sp. D714]MDQ2178004.1 hypothetical protein [Marinifilum sp. D714]